MERTRAIGLLAPMRSSVILIVQALARRDLLKRASRREQAPLGRSWPHRRSLQGHPGRLGERPPRPSSPRRSLDAFCVLRSPLAARSTISARWTRLREVSWLRANPSRAHCSDNRSITGALLDTPCTRLRDRYQLAVVTNDIWLRGHSRIEPAVAVRAVAVKSSSLRADVRRARISTPSGFTLLPEPSAMRPTTWSAHQARSVRNAHCVALRHQ